MKASYQWLKDYCAFDLPAHELSARLSHSGLNVDTFEPRGEDWMLDVEVKSNRPDCLCHLGIAREAAAITGAPWRRPDFELIEAGPPAFEDRASVRVDAPDLCPHYTARVIAGVRVGPSPAWLQQRLEVCGIRPINNVVDATNYVMLECGQPLHAFDLARLDGAAVIVRRAAAGETITLIDGSRVELTGQECVIADRTRPVALAGVMGGLESEISDATVDVLLESARFDPRNNRRTARRHGLSSDSSYRYQRGIDPEITAWASRRACALIMELAGGQLLSGSAQLRFDTAETPEVTLRAARTRLLLGIELPTETAARILSGLGIDVLARDGRQVTVRIPSWRSDLSREIDLIEEVARIHGYDRIAETTSMPVRPSAPDPSRTAERRARLLLAGQGFTEAMTYTLIAPDPVQRAQPWSVAEPIAVRNPVTNERSHLRQTTMANLLGVKAFNAAHGTPAVDLFELGRVHLGQPDQELPREMTALAVLTDRDDGLRVLKGVLANLCDELGLQEDIEEEAGGRGPFDAEECVQFRLNGSLLGVAGVVSRAIADRLDLNTRPALMEIDLRLLTDNAHLARAYRPIPTYPATRRDLAVVVADNVRWADVRRCVEAARPDVLEAVDYLSTYRGEAIPAGHKSLALALTLRCADRTITAAEAEQARDVVLHALSDRLGARLR